MSKVPASATVTGGDPLAPRVEASLLSAILEFSADGIAYIDPDLVIRAASEAFARQVRRPLELVVGHPAEEVIAGRLARPDSIFDQVRTTGVPFRAEAEPIEFADQPERGVTYWDSSVSPIYEPDGAFRGYLLIQREVTECVRAAEEREQLLAEARRERMLLERVVQEAPAGIVVLRGPEYRYALVNPAFQQLARGKGKILGRTVADVFPEVADQLIPLLDRVYQTGEPYYAVDSPFVIERGRGPEEAFFTFTYIRLYDPDGILVLTQETTDQVTTRRRLERERAQLEGVIQSISEGVIIADMQGNILVINPAGARVFGYTSPEEYRRHLAEFQAIWELSDLNGRPIPFEEWPLSRLLRGETFTNWEYQAYRRDIDKRMILSQSGSLVRDKSGQPILAVLTYRDVTAQREAEHERERLLAQVEALYGAERSAHSRAEAAVRDRDRFLSAAAHELKTPVANLRGFAELALRRLERERALDPEQALRRIVHESDRLSRLVNQLLDTSAIEAGELEIEPRETDVAELVRDGVTTAQAGTRRHSLVVQAPASLPAVVDPSRLEQVLHNLLDNAIKFSPGGTPIEIELTTPDVETLRLAVRDHGPGIPPERRGRLFSRFYQAQTGRPFAGLGLGLYVARHIVELHGGRIEAEFPSDGGTRFVVTLPRGGVRSMG